MLLLPWHRFTQCARKCAWQNSGQQGEAKDRRKDTGSAGRLQKSSKLCKSDIYNEKVLEKEKQMTVACKDFEV